MLCTVGWDSLSVENPRTVVKNHACLGVNLRTVTKDLHPTWKVGIAFSCVRIVFDLDVYFVDSIIDSHRSNREEQ
jgi:hypothetical protein